jgi:hypothetical protein
MKRYYEQMEEESGIRKINKDLARRRKVPLKPTDWVCVQAGLPSNKLNSAGTRNSPSFSFLDYTRCKTSFVPLSSWESRGSSYERRVMVGGGKCCSCVCNFSAMRSMTDSEVVTSIRKKIRQRRRN